MQEPKSQYSDVKCNKDICDREAQSEGQTDHVLRYVNVSAVTSSGELSSAQT